VTESHRRVGREGTDDGHKAKADAPGLYGNRARIKVLYDLLHMKVLVSKKCGTLLLVHRKSCELTMD
jgi:hypothetical protein